MPSGQDFFSLQELLFIAIVLGSVVTLAGAGIAAMMREPSERLRPLRALRWLGVVVGLYMVTVLAFSLKPPETPARHKGDPQCRAHRCITIADVARSGKGADVAYTLTLRLTNSGRFPFKDQVAGLYLVDTAGRRYDATSDSGRGQFDVNHEIGPYQTVMTQRVFTLPRDVRIAGFLVDRGREAPPIGCLVIGGNCWYERPAPPVPIE